jgi:hypothetical protein
LLQAFARLNDDFWRFVSASKNSVPGDRVEREVRARLKPNSEFLRCRNSGPSAGCSAPIPDEVERLKLPAPFGWIAKPLNADGAGQRG